MKIFLWKVEAGWCDLMLMNLCSPSYCRTKKSNQVFVDSLYRQLALNQLFIHSWSIIHSVQRVQHFSPSSIFDLLLKDSLKWKWNDWLLKTRQWWCEGAAVELTHAYWPIKRMSTCQDSVCFMPENHFLPLCLQKLNWNKRWRHRKYN